MVVVMRVMNDKVLVEEDRVNEGDKFHSDQVLVFRQSCAALVNGGVTRQPLQKRPTLFHGITTQVQLLDRVVPLLSRKWQAEVLRQLVAPRHLYCGKLQDHFWRKRVNSPQERVGCLETSNVITVDPLAGGSLVHLSHVQGHVLKEHAFPVCHLHFSAATQGAKKSGDISPEIL